MNAGACSSVGRVEPRSVVQDGQVVAAPTVFLSPASHHRALDGYPAALFLAALRARLEQPTDL
jgi:pyruvate dehydrogenase E2 component (dihydrolipoamide acetyltransferase)